MVSVLQTIDSGHEDLIHGAEIDYYGLNLATCSSDNTIKVNNQFSNELMKIIKLYGPISL